MGSVEGSIAGVIVEAPAVGWAGSVEEGTEVGLVDGVSGDTGRVEILCHNLGPVVGSSDRGAAGEDSAGRLLVWKAEVDIEVAVAVAAVKAWIF